MHAVRVDFEAQASFQSTALHRDSVPRVREATRYAEHGVAARPAHDDARGRAAFERAVLPWQPTLRISAQALTKNRSDAEDLLQETLLRAWRFWPRYREQDSCRAWLQRILNNVFRSEHRARGRRRLQLLEYAAAQSSPSERQTALHAGGAPHKRVTHEQLERSLAALNPGQRRILHLVEVDERSYRETAHALACPIGTVMSRLHRARAALRAELVRAEAQAGTA